MKLQVLRLQRPLGQKHSLYALLVVAAHQGGVVEITFLRGLFLSQNVAMISMLSLDFAGAGESETLLGSGFGFHSWHYFTVFLS